MAAFDVLGIVLSAVSALIAASILWLGVLGVLGVLGAVAVVPCKRCGHLALRSPSNLAPACPHCHHRVVTRAHLRARSVTYRH
ncbi:MAG TPA: hypothetical protein VKV36_10685 [Acidimicrobiales bacterium]|nr:hypothetical protein [Acidimicrobiales bacterium]